MALELCTALGLSNRDLSGQIIQICEEHSCDANFVVTSLMWNAFESKATVCLLAFHNSENHYINVCKKLGLNLKTLIESEKCFVIEAFKLISGSVGSNIGDSVIEDNIENIFVETTDNINRLKSVSEYVYLIIDDVSDLLCGGTTVQNIVAFLYACRRLLKSVKGLTLIVSSHQSESNVDQQLISNLISHTADCTISVAGLKTGVSTEVSGSIEVVNNQMSNEQNIWNCQNYFHFQLSDRHIKVFAPGSII